MMTKEHDGNLVSVHKDLAQTSRSVLVGTIRRKRKKKERGIN